jgi:glycosyltransferase involved in cell wall biosynthesis
MCKAEFVPIEKSNPVISIITVTYNSDKTLEQTIQSVIRQNYEGTEYILVDGLSSDLTMMVANRYRDNFRTIISEKDYGIYDAMNKGIRLSHGQYVVLLNSDDEFTTDAIQLFLKSLKENNDSNAIYFGDANVIYEDLKCCHRKQSSLALKYRMSIFHQAMFVPKSIYNTYGLYNTNYKISADYEFCLRTYLEGVKFIHIKHPLVNFRSTKEQASYKFRNLSVNEDYNIMFQYLGHLGKVYYMLNKTRESIRHFGKILMVGLGGQELWSIFKKNIVLKIWK